MILNAQIPNPSSSEEKHESEAHNEVQEVVKGYSPRSTRSTSGKTTIPTV